MKKILFSVLLLCFNYVVFSQDTEIGDTGDGSDFIKRIEPNLLQKAMVMNGKTYYRYNLRSKTKIEKFLFGEINARVEFFIEPSFEGAYGMRMVKDSLSAGYLLESRRISNWKEVSSEMLEKFPPISFKAEQVSTVPKEEIERSGQYNSMISAKRNEEALKRYSIASLSVPVKDGFAEKLYGTIYTAIKNFVQIGDPAMILDGYTATFRCVVGDEVWTLTIQMPDGVIKQLVDICNQIIKDVETHTYNESKYIESLDGISQSVTAERE